MTIHVSIGEAEKRLSELVAAAVRGEDVVLQDGGASQVRLVAIAHAALSQAEREEIAARRVAAIGKWKKDFEGFDTSRAALKLVTPIPMKRYGAFWDHWPDTARQNLRSSLSRLQYLISMDHVP